MRSVKKKIYKLLRQNGKCRSRQTYTFTVLRRYESRIKKRNSKIRRRSNYI